MTEIHDIQTIHDTLFDALCYFDDFARSNDIEYFLSNGTLLGAAKYGDFIPWDDDVDILIPREDYDRLVELKSINTDRYKLICLEQIPDLRIPYAKLSCEDTVLQEGTYDFGATFGVSIDIFPIDIWSPCLLVSKFQALRNEMFKRLLICANASEFTTNKTGIKRFILRCIFSFGRKLGYKRMLNAIRRSADRSKKRKRKYIGCLVWTSHHLKEVLPSSLFDNTELLSIRGRSFPACAGYEEYLDNLYGKWREELPPEKQHSNHDIRVWLKDA